MKDKNPSTIPLHKGIRFKVILGIVSILLFTLVPFGLFQIQDQEKLLTEALRNKSLTIVRSVSSNSPEAIENFDDLTLQNLVFKAESDKEVAYINILNPDNELIVEDDFTQDGKVIKKKKKVEADNILSLKENILKPGEEGEEPEILGSVEGGFYKDAVIKEITRKKVIFSITLLGISLSIVIVMYLFLSRSYVNPVLKLSEAASSLENENLEIETDKSDELGHLGNIFKEMRTTVNNQKIILEKQVAERTIELNREKDNVTKLLNNMAQAVFKVNKQKEILAPISAYAKDLFGDDIEGKNIFKVLYTSIDVNSVQFSQMNSAYSVLFGADEIQWFASDGLLPEKINVEINEEPKILKVLHEPIYDENDEVEFILYVIEDITERVKAEEKLAQKNEQMKIVHESLSFGSRKELTTILLDFLDLLNKSFNIIYRLKNNSSPQKELNELFRYLHTIKGGSAALKGIGAKAHDVESVVNELRKSETSLDNELLDKLMKESHELKGLSLKYIKVAIKELKVNIKLTDNIFGNLNKLDSHLENIISNFENEIQESNHLLEKLYFTLYTFSSVDETKISSQIYELIKRVKTNKEEGSLYSEKVKADIFENLSYFKSKLKPVLEDLTILKDSGFNKEEVSIPSENINCLRNEILHLIKNKSISLENVDSIFNKAEDGESILKLIRSFEKVVQDTSQKLGKKVQMGVEGSDLLIKPDTAKCLRESLIHIVRNSVDHGIEVPEVRSSNGKQEIGSLKISFQNHNEEIILSIEDDGGGIDGEKLLTKAIETGSIKDKEITEKEKLDLLFLPSLSTKEDITDVSGRGVGMDAVRSGLNDMGGRISVESKIQKGTKFTITLPNK
ncbi:MAG: hypothetical protein CME68_01075 [Halobacteriovoraceae bacterium]|nr:hypothetical protein [Halobacteriovoraceae bacterium]